MAQTKTTLTAAVAINDTAVNVTSATGFVAGMPFRIDQEWLVVQKGYVSGLAIPCLRGQAGTATATHASGANVVVELASDLPMTTAPQTDTTQPYRPARLKQSYSANGLIANPPAGCDVIATLNGTGALAMTLNNPSPDQDGDLLIIVANGKAAHTVTYTAGIGNGGSSFDVATFSASIVGGCILVAQNGFWNLIGNGLAGATGATGAPTFA